MAMLMFIGIGIGSNAWRFRFVRLSMSSVWWKLREGAWDVGIGTLRPNGLRRPVQELTLSISFPGSPVSQSDLNSKSKYKHMISISIACYYCAVQKYDMRYPCHLSGIAIHQHGKRQ